MTARVALVTSNGGGLGHLTRAVAVARRLPADVSPVVITQSQAVGLVRRAGLPVEHLPSRAYLRVPLATWQRYARERVGELLRTYAVDAVVYDGAVPPEGILDAFEASGAARTWLRRATWRSTADPSWVGLSRRFDLVIEPGDVADDDDHGPTTIERDRVLRCGPITLVDRSDLLPRERARAELDLDDRPAALLTLGAGNIDDIASPLGRFAQALHDRGTQVVVTRSPIAHDDVDLPTWVRVVRRYPVAGHLRAFDLAVAAAGYNVVHELLAANVPAVLVPNRRTGLDDQVTRARAAARAGVALALEDPTADAIEGVLRLLDHHHVRRRLRRRASELVRANGAGHAARLVARSAGVTGDAVPGGART